MNMTENYLEEAGFTIDFEAEGISTREGGGRLPPGYHKLRVEKVELSNNPKNGIKSLIVTFVSIETGGKVRDRMTLENPKRHQQNDDGKRAQTAVEIGRSQLLSLMTYGRVPPGPDGKVVYRSPSQLHGLTVGAVVVQGDDWVGQNGDLMKGLMEIATKGKPYFFVEEIDDLRAKNAMHPALVEAAQKQAIGNTQPPMGGATAAPFVPAAQPAQAPMPGFAGKPPF